MCTAPFSAVRCRIGGGHGRCLPPSLTVLMNAGPWLPVPPQGYGGIENVVAPLVPELRPAATVTLATVGESRWRSTSASACSTREVRRGGPYNMTPGIAHAHMQRVAGWAPVRHRRRA